MSAAAAAAAVCDQFENGIWDAMAGKRRASGGSKEPKAAKAPRLSAKQLEEQPYIPEVVAWFLGPRAIHVFSSTISIDSIQSFLSLMDCFKPADLEREVKTSV